MTRWLLLPAALLLAGCPTDPAREVPEELTPLAAHPDVTDTLLQVASYQQPCAEEDGTLRACLLIRFEGEDAWTEYPAFIDGFTAGWGTRISLDVTSDGADGWTLVSEVAQVPKPGQTFVLRLQDDYLVGGLRLIGGRQFECEEFDLCAPLDEQLAAGNRFDTWMRHPHSEGTTDPLTLTALPQ